MRMMYAWATCSITRSKRSTHARARRPDLDTDRLLNLALVRLIEIVGEAANRVSQAGQDQLPSIPWRQIISMRNRIVHGYDEVDFDILWAVISDDLPRLIDTLKTTLGRV